MKRILKHKAFKNTLVYVGSGIVNRAIPFLLLPVFTRYLSPSDYGIVASFVTLVMFIGMFTGLNSHGAVAVNYFKESSEKFGLFLGNLLWILLASTFVMLIFAFVLQPIITREFFIPKQWVYIATVLAAAQFITTVNLALWIAEEKPKAYGVFQLSQAFIMAALSLYLIVALLMGWQGRFIAVTITGVLFSLMSIRFVSQYKDFSLKYDKDTIVETLKFGVPLIPHALGGWLRTSLDRLFLISMLGTAAAGIYSVGYQVGVIMSIVVMAFNNVWGPMLFKKLSGNPTFEDKKRIVLFTYVYFGVVLVFALMLKLVAPWLFSVFIDERFHDGVSVIAWVAFGYAFTGMYFMVGQYLFFVKKTQYLAMATLSTAILHAIISYTLIGKNGSIGAAQATTISFGLNFLVVWYLGNKFYPMPWSLRNVS